ncbi:hypothetical protein [Novosphingobium kaempferiae]|uniref:hypothetical protein n=1 Tax=Novosphingobium kaempferiae TaxID=2896849 RepID=UPI001E53756D|nr:hypothetical protein [Novosphingobium kaempferiae]
MNKVLLALAGFVSAGLALNTAPAWGVEKAATAKAASRKPAAKKPAARKKPAVAPAKTSDEIALAQSEDATRVSAWVAASGDNHALPYAIVDKKSASLLLFDATGKQVAHVPVLLGIAPGDDASPGIGSKNLSEIGPAEKTTPAGRFLAKFGVAAGKQRVLWVDYATSVALHPIPKPGKPKEKRRERMLSPAIDDNRITFGCINVPIAFYTRNLSPMFAKKGGYVYVTPDVKALEDVFPRIRIQSFANTGG